MVDEVDVFFGPDFHGKTYNQVMELHEPKIAEILSKIWRNHNEDSRRQKLADVQASTPHTKLLLKMPSFKHPVDNEIRLVLDHVHHIDKERHCLDANQDRIGCKVHDTISHEVTHGHRTVFAHMKEADKGNLKDRARTLARVQSVTIQCRQFSCANISPSRTLGALGTLEAMGECKKEVLHACGVRKFVFVPSVYGKLNFVRSKLALRAAHSSTSGGNGR